MPFLLRLSLFYHIFGGTLESVTESYQIKTRLRKNKPLKGKDLYKLQWIRKDTLPQGSTPSNNFLSNLNKKN